MTQPSRRRLVELHAGQITLRLPYMPAVPLTPDLARRLRNELNATLSLLTTKPPT